MPYLPMIAFTLMMAGILPARAQPDIVPITERARDHFDIRQFDLESNKRRRYRLFIALPRQAAPAEGYPILYLLDGNAHFPFAVNSYKTENGAAPLIVAIGYQSDREYDVPARTRDYTPPATIVDPHFDKGGEAEAFYQFLQSGVKPWVEARYRVNTQKQTLAGHSFGGLFTLYTLFNHSASFQRYVAASPSIWWGDGVVIPEKTPLLDAPPQSITLSVGECEDAPEKAAAKQPADAGREERHGRRQMVTKARTLAARLQHQGANARFILFAGKNHGDVIPDAIAQAVIIAGQ
ncbi:MULTISPECIES: alpha/beta hydrolase [Brenneria]|uniref:Alpha/beta hydrolase n=1 Tax=Brenneria nigrifluens DSM 30175 = ATCC 13028 TaxID=1121120 RepID=A0A2U1UHL5_9GAMM|nr:MULTISPECIES: alpha/beta hydrolase-fold protein [Brenneria]EHD20517.1 esterase [Brenneria sp. EniD312]PWC21074.1 alpha/beta hydrolase [Brenneria nigrifluens] [Brenneria nigrifluens DSM 30175 = ATCC 13028]QCR03713.1 alpha/beta hydrolase [Brenneria nigrifluens] [Brenneria nigrifluens DSM 30175 = ATCC 13028]